MIFGIDFFSGSSTLFSTKLKIIKVKIPARKNLVPAKRMIDAVSFDDILNSLYPIFIAGNAEPQSKQQKPAINQTNGVFVRIFSFILQSYRYSLFIKIFF